MSVVREKEWWILGGGIALFFWRPLSGETFFFRDLYVLFYAKRLFLVQAIQSGQLPLWDPMTHGGQPYLATLSNTFFHPTNLLYFVFDPLTAFNLVIVLSFILCGWAAYALARQVRLSPWAAFTAGAVYALCGFTLSSANLLVILLGLPFVPATLALMHKFAEEGRARHLVLACCCGAIPLAELSLVLFLTIAVWVLAVPAPRLKRRIAIGASVIVFSVALAMIQTLPAIEVIRNSSRAEMRSYTYFAYWSLNPRRLPELVVPGFFGPTDRLARSNYWGGRFEEGFPYILSIYMGAPVLMLAGAGALTGRIAMARRLRLALAGLALVGLIGALGDNLPGFRVAYDHVPVMGTLRYPVKALEMTLLPLAILAASGVEHLRHRLSRGDLLAFFTAAILLFGAAAVFSTDGLRPDRAFFGQQLVEHSASQLRRSMLQAASIAAVVAALLALVSRARRDPSMMIALMVAGDLALAGLRVNPFAPRELFAEPPLVAAIRGEITDGRFWRPREPDEIVVRAPSDDVVWFTWWSAHLLRNYVAPIYGIPVIFHEDYDGLAPRASAKVGEAIRAMTWPERLDWFQKSAISVFLAPDPLNDPRVDRITSVPNTDGSPLHLYRLRDAPFVRFEAACRASLRPLRRTINERVVEVDAPCPGKLVFAETHYPGWRVDVDGRAAPLLIHDTTFSAVALPAGRHVVTKRYRPLLPAAGAAVSLVSLALLLLVARRTRVGA